MYSHLECEYCSEVRTTARGLFWHLRCDHKMSNDSAYISVADSLAKCAEKYGSDKNLERNDKDLLSNYRTWGKKYNSNDVKYFDRRGR